MFYLSYPPTNTDFLPSALAEGARYVERLARVFATHFGMCYSIVLVGPDDKGNPRVQRYRIFYLPHVGY